MVPSETFFVVGLLYLRIAFSLLSVISATGVYGLIRPELDGPDLTRRKD